MSASSVLSSPTSYVSPAPFQTRTGTLIGTGAAASILTFTAFDRGIWAVAVSDITTPANYSYRLVVVTPTGGDIQVTATALTGLVDATLVSAVGGSTYTINAPLNDVCRWVATKLA
jgi:hypothetical protein